MDLAQSGIEELYRLQEVDPSTIRPLQKPLLPQENPTYQERLPPLSEEQLTFSFVPPERPWFYPFHSTALLPQVLARELSAKGISNLGEAESALREGRLERWGLGHRDALCAELDTRRRMEAASPFSTPAFLLACLGELTPLQRALLLEKEPLSRFLPPSNRESAYLARLTPEQKKKECQEACEILSRAPHLAGAARELVSSLCVGWVRSRGGTAHEHELEDHLLAFADCGEDLLLLLEEFSRWVGPIWQWGLFPTAPGVWSADLSFRQEWQEVEEEATTYFYHPSVSYPIEELSSWLLRWGFREGKRYSPEWLAALLIHSPRFVAIREEKRGRVVRLAEMEVNSYSANR